MVLVVAAGAVTTSANAATFTVTRVDDPVPGTCDPSGCSLREAIMAANAAPGPDTVMLPTATYALTIPDTTEAGTGIDASQGDLDVTDELTIDGGSGAGPVVDAGARFVVGDDSITMTQAGTTARVFHVASAALTLDFVHVRGGSGDQGAGVLVDHGRLVLLVASIEHNVANGTCCGGGIAAIQSQVELFSLSSVSANAVAQCCGGGIYNESSQVRVNDKGVIAHNDVFGCCGAGVYNWTDPSSGRWARLEITRTTIGGNDVRGCCGGGIYNETGPTVVRITTSRIGSNHSSGDCCGGAIYSNGPQADVDAVDSTFSDNTTAGCCGGAIYNEGSFTLERGAIVENSIANCCGGGIATVGAGASTTLTNVTVSNNAGGTEPGDPSLPSAGGLYVDSGTMTLDHVTVADNTGSNGASGIANGDVGGGATGTVTIRNSIVSGSSAAPQCLGPMTSQGYNIASDASCTFTQPTDRTSTNPQLGPLTMSFGILNPAGEGHHPLNPGSPAIDAIPTSLCPPPAVDQLSTLRPQDRGDAPGTGCDIGAVEMPASSTPPSSTPTPTITPTPTPTASPAPSAPPTATPTPSPTATPTASPTPSPTPTPEPIDPRCDDPAVVCGTDGSETITGTEEGELIICGDGDDVVDALGGDDRIECGDEGDTGDKDVDAGSGDDEVDCDGTGDDHVLGGGGDDEVDCGAGNDRVGGGAGNDDVASTRGRDRIRGGAGRDRIWGGPGPDTLRGGHGADRLLGGAGRDRVWGDAGKDSLSGGRGRHDLCADGPGRDRLKGCEVVRSGR